MRSANDEAVWVGSGWKMHKTVPESLRWLDEVTASEAWQPRIRVFALPPHTSLFAMAARRPPTSRLTVGAQNAHWASEGPFTGEVSMQMIKSAGAELVELGHAERRAAFGETDADVARKVRAALDTGVRPLVCVGETSAARAEGSSDSWIRAQVVAALSKTEPGEVADVMFAYEPIWAIGTRARVADVDVIARAADVIRGAASEASGGPCGPVLYGGSVTAGNAPGIVSRGGVQGVFVGRASWQSADFLRLIGAIDQQLLEDDHGR